MNEGSRFELFGYFGTVWSPSPQAQRTGCVYQRGNVWWLKYSRYGKSYRESTHTSDKRKAEKMLRIRLAEITSGTFVGPQAERVRIEELAEDFLREYRINGRKSIDDVDARDGSCT